VNSKNLLTLAELSPQELGYVLELSTKMKLYRTTGFGENALKKKSLAMVFEKSSTRTRVSFQVAITELGGFAIVLSSSELQLGRGETIEDTARVLSRYVHCIMARVNRHDDLERLARSSSVPVVNGLSELYHPVQVLADLMTLQEHKGRLKGLKVAWVGDGDNVCNSWMYGAALSGMDFIAATPKKYEPPVQLVSETAELAKMTGGSVRVVNEPDVAVKDADCVMTDTFVSMGLDRERDERMKVFLPRYQVNKRLMALARPDAVFQHCLPAHRGEEVTSDVIDGPNSVVFDEAENRLHTTKALLCFLLIAKENLASLL
jgi:ornithine carbamoyltransferase